MIDYLDDQSGKSARLSALDEKSIGDQWKTTIAVESLLSNKLVEELDETINEPGAELGEVLHESILYDVTAYPATAVSFRATHAIDKSEAIESIQSFFPNVNHSIEDDNHSIEEPRKTLVESLVMDKTGTSLSVVMPRPNLQNRQQNEQNGIFHLTRFPMVLFIFLALLAGLLGGVGSIYLFQLSSLQTPTIAPTSELEASTAVPTSMQPASSVEVASSPIKELGSAAPTAESPAVPPVISAPPIFGANSPPVPTASMARLPGTDLESPPMPGLATTMTPPATESKTSPVISSAPVERVAETPLIASYMSSGNTLLARGDVASARLFYEKAADMGFAAAMTAVAGTYDPVVLKQLGIKGFRADPVKAVEWYLKAEKAGDPTTAERLNELKRWLSNSPALHESEVNALRQLLR